MRTTKIIIIDKIDIIININYCTVISFHPESRRIIVIPLWFDRIEDSFSVSVHTISIQRNKKNKNSMSEESF